MRLIIRMKVGKTLTYKSAVIYYSATGNTKGMIEEVGFEGFDIYNISNGAEDIPFNDYDLIVLGASTWGRGLPPKPFYTIRDELALLEGKRVGLLGSGQSLYGDDFCGALDLIEKLIGDKNKIVFKYKFESYPKKSQIVELKEILKECLNETN